VQLQPLDDVAEHFSSPPARKHIHIIVQRPRSSSPSKRSSQPQLPLPPPLHPDTPIRRLTQVQAYSPIPLTVNHPSTSENPFSPPPASQTPQRASSTNPFLAHKSFQRPQSTDPSPQNLPPLPPRKPAPPIPLAPPPRHASLILPPTANASPSLKTSASAPTYYSPQKSTHVTSTLMRQSLQASKTAQSLKKAEEELERERVLSILKRSSINGGPAAGVMKNESQFPDRVFETISDSATTVPPLPRRRNHVQHQVPSPPSSPNSMSTGSSLERVTTAALAQSGLNGTNKDNTPFHSFDGSPFSPTSPFATHSTRFSSRPLPDPSSYRTSSEHRRMASMSPSRRVNDLPHAVPPPTHPTRKQVRSTPILTSTSSSSASSSSSAAQPHSTPTPPTARMSRSHSLHQPASPPIPPPRRKRPESVQITPTSDTPKLGSPFDPATPSRRRGAGISRNLSISLSTPSPSDKDNEKDLSKSVSNFSSGPSSTSLSGSGSGSGLTNIQRTLAKLDAIQPRIASSLDALQPHLDRARYKAEAGISWRGYLTHHGLGGKWAGGNGEGEESLINGQKSAESVTSENAEDSEGDGDTNKDRGGVDADNLKWRADEGWNQL
jgi:hypothetical protein